MSVVCTWALGLSDMDRIGCMKRQKKNEEKKIKIVRFYSLLFTLKIPECNVKKNTDSSSRTVTVYCAS